MIEVLFYITWGVGSILLITISVIISAVAVFAVLEKFNMVEPIIQIFNQVKRRFGGWLWERTLYPVIDFIKRYLELDLKGDKL